ncbi:glycosyltransferase [Carnimonas bestiolae]|uniref:glycosyltransferase n=1 Tax=Carnimonas bestiolae TaxID=3402172 RepID=UPI003EDC0C9A
MCAKRFAFVMKDLFGGGAEKSLLYTADELRKRGNIVRFYIMRDVIEQTIPDGLEVVNLGIHNQWTRAFNMPWIEKWQARQLEKAFAEFKPDTVFSCSADKITRHVRHPNLYFMIKGNVTSSPMSEEARRKRYAKDHEFYDGRKIITVSHGLLDDLLHIVGLEPSFARTIYEPYDPEMFKAFADEPTEFPVPEFILSLGTLEPRKRHDRLLRAYAASGVTTPLIIMGKGKPEDHQRIEKAIDDNGVRDRVLMMDFTTNPYPYIQRAKFLVLASDAEGLPRVLVESLMLKTPLVSVDCPSGPRETLLYELQDYLVPMTDEAAFADAIARMDRAPVVIDERYLAPFRPETVMPEYEAL